MKIAALWSRPARMDGMADEVARAFDARSIKVQDFADPAALFDAWGRTHYDAILLNDERPVVRHWLAALRSHVASLKAVIVVGPGDAQAIAQALMWGADDYASEAEGPTGWVQRVLGRIRARAGVQADAAPLVLGTYSLEVSRCVLTSTKQRVKLTARECIVARVLFESPGRLHSAAMLSAAVFGSEDDGHRRSIEQHIYKLRKKCELASAGEDAALSIESVYASGYRLRILVPYEA
jgi:DNA-binding response OmpR family regulator